MGETRLDAQPLLEVDEDDLADDNFDLPYHQAQKEKAMKSDSWLNDRCMRHADREWLEPEEEKFWQDLLDKYLFPVKRVQNHDQVKLDLFSLRNQISFGFYMTNALFILVVFLLQLKKDCLNVEWPLGERVNRSIIPCNSETGDEEYVEMGLQLEPIGFVFLFFFMSLLIIQFIAMLLHRFGTLSHILAATELFCWRKSANRLSEDELVAEHFVEIAKELQAIRGIDEDSNEPGYASKYGDLTYAAEAAISRRRVVKSLEHSRRHRQAHRTETLDAAFRKRFFNLKEDGGDYGYGEIPPNHGISRSGVASGIKTRLSRRQTIRHETFRAIKSRRDKIYGTLDKVTGETLANGLGNFDDDSPQRNTTGGGRGPSRRRLDKIFQDKNGHAIPESGVTLSGNPFTDTLNVDDVIIKDGSDDSELGINNPPMRPDNHRLDDEDNIHIINVNSGDGGRRLRHTDSWGEVEYGSVGQESPSSPRGVPLRKMIAQNALANTGGHSGGCRDTAGRHLIQASPPVLGRRNRIEDTSNTYEDGEGRDNIGLTLDNQRRVKEESRF